MNQSPEQFYCIDCLRIRSLNTNLRCSVCYSDNVVAAQDTDMNISDTYISPIFDDQPKYSIRIRSLILGLFGAICISLYLWLAYIGIYVLLAPKK